jgi:hypothetical protein
MPMTPETRPLSRGLTGGGPITALIQPDDNAASFPGASPHHFPNWSARSSLPRTRFVLLHFVHVGQPKNLPPRAAARLTANGLTNFSARVLVFLAYDVRARAVRALVRVVQIRLLLAVSHDASLGLNGPLHGQRLARAHRFKGKRGRHTGPVCA